MNTSNIGRMALGLSILMTANLACDFELPELRSNNVPEECEVQLNSLRRGDTIFAGTTLSVETTVNLDCEFFDATEPVVDFNLWEFSSGTSEPLVWGPFLMQAVEGEDSIWSATVDLEIPIDLQPGDDYVFGATVTLPDQEVGLGHSIDVTVVQAN